MFYNLHYSLDNLGLPQTIKNNLLQNIQKQSGLILITGPTGSGKTTTLYTLLQHLDCKRKNITTIEDPIEYQLDQINQMDSFYLVT